MKPRSVVFLDKCTEKVFETATVAPVTAEPFFDVEVSLVQELSIRLPFEQNPFMASAAFDFSFWAEPKKTAGRSPPSNYPLEQVC